MNWIPTSERLPAHMGSVWVTIEIPDAMRFTDTGWFDKDQWRITDAHGNYRSLDHNETVTAWLEIPSRPPPYNVNVEKSLECDSCVPFNNQHVAEYPKISRDVRPALRELKALAHEFCKCWCHSRDGLTICPDCAPVHNSRDYQLRCRECGSERIYVRGQYPGEDNRLTCPQCTQERLDDLTATTGTAKWVPSPRNTGMGTDGFYDDCSICGEPMPSGNHPQCVAIMSGGAE